MLKLNRDVHSKPYKLSWIKKRWKSDCDSTSESQIIGHYTENVLCDLASLEACDNFVGTTLAI